jgi:homoserine kinase
MAVDIANTFTFDNADSYSFKGFDIEFCNEDNLVCQAYKLAFKKASKKDIPVAITFKGDIPIARGLGSSSSLIVAGVMAANYYLGNIYSKEDILNICAEIEGHPDNVAPAIYGGFTASYKTDDRYKCINYEISYKLHFYVIIPPVKVKTEDARGVLPKTLTYKAAVNNISKIIHLPLALKEGNIELLKELCEDNLHEPYRSKLIEGYEELRKDALKHNSILLISGSGSTMLVISSDSELENKFKSKYGIKKVNPSFGAKVEEI